MATVWGRLLFLPIPEMSSPREFMETRGGGEGEGVMEALGVLPLGEQSHGKAALPKTVACGAIIFIKSHIPGNKHISL